MASHALKLRREVGGSRLSAPSEACGDPKVKCESPGGYVTAAKIHNVCYLCCAHSLPWHSAAAAIFEANNCRLQLCYPWCNNKGWIQQFSFGVFLPGLAITIKPDRNPWVLHWLSCPPFVTGAHNHCWSHQRATMQHSQLSWLHFRANCIMGSTSFWVSLFSKWRLQVCCLITTRHCDQGTNGGVILVKSSAGFSPQRQALFSPSHSNLSPFRLLINLTLHLSPFDGWLSGHTQLGIRTNINTPLKPTSFGNICATM